MKNTEKTLKTLNISLIIGLVIAIILSNFTTFATDCKNIRQNVMRLHIVANSDSANDQRVKLLIRDEILQNSNWIFDQNGSVATAKDNAKQKLTEIEQIAEKVLREQGVTNPVKAKVCNMFFDTRNYENFTMPAGRYDALRIEIGEAKGKNWWCVLYPALCLPAAEKDDLSKTFSNEEIDILTGKKRYEIKFASLELIEKIKNYFNSSQK